MHVFVALAFIIFFDMFRHVVLDGRLVVSFPQGLPGEGFSSKMLGVGSFMENPRR